MKRKGGGGGGGKGGGSRGSRVGGGGSGGGGWATWRIVIIVISILLFLGILWYVLHRYVFTHTEWWQERLEKRRLKAEEKAEEQSRLDAEKMKIEAMGGDSIHSH